MHPKIGFLSPFDPTDRRASSGTNFMVYQKLKEIGDVTWIPITTPLIWKVAYKACGVFSRMGLPDIQPAIYNLFKPYHKFPARSELDKYDVIVAYFINNMIDRINTSAPIIHIADAVMPILLDYYPNFHDTPRFVKNMLISKERKSLPCADSLVFSSQWAADGAVSQGADPGKVEIVEFGANIADSDIPPVTTRNPKPNSINLLFLGAFWERKGGQEAIDAAKWLNQNGVQATLHIVGVMPPSNIEIPDYVKAYGFKNKNNADEYAELMQIISGCDALILPTKAECSAIAFAEAAAYGLPVFTYDTGGVGNYVLNDATGYRLPTNCTGADFGHKIKECLDKGIFPSLSEKARLLYEERLNWDVWADRMKEIIEKTLR